MAGYEPLKITGFETGLVQEREEFLLPGDAYPVLQNAFVWRERIKRKQGCELLGRLRRVLTAKNLGNTDGSGAFTGNIRTILSLETNAEIEPKSVSITVGGQTFTDPSGNGVLVGGGGGTINYATTIVTLQTSPALPATPVTAAFNYFPSLPVMGLRTRLLKTTNTEDLIAFDQKYAYQFSGGWQEFIPGTTWNGSNSEFFWSTNYWQSPPPPQSNASLFWVTNDSTTLLDPIYYTDDVAWVAFAPIITQGTTIRLQQCLAMLPFRGRLVTFNTREGTTLANSVNYPQRIRWAAIGNPISDTSTIFPNVNQTNPSAWFDNVRGQGGFLDIPTSDVIQAVGFVRDNLVIYCSRSTWQLRYTGRSIAPFQIEKVNSELGSESTFSAVQFDTSLVGIGDKGVVECDSYKSERIDIKIPDLIFQFNNENFGTKRVHGIRDFVQRLAYWTYPFAPSNGTFPDKRLVYNYENDSWAIFTDSFTCFGTFQPQESLTWAEADRTWEESNDTWVQKPALIPLIVAGNQQGFVEYVGSSLDEGTAQNDISLTIENITGQTPQPTIIKSVNHNFQTGQIISIVNIPTGTPFASSLNGKNFQVDVIDADTFYIYKFNTVTQKFSDPQTDASATYIGGGNIIVIDNFIIQSKKFGFLDEGQNIQMGYLDVLMDSTDTGAISLYVFKDYDNTNAVNTVPQNDDNDKFFNVTVPTTPVGGSVADKNWRRIYCPVRASFITLVWSLSDAQMNGVEQDSDVQFDAQILWIRKAGRLQSMSI